MLVKGVLLFAAVVLAADASVIVNIFKDDDVESSSLFSVKDCELQWCELACQRLGFPGGMCDGYRCKCDIKGAKVSSGLSTNSSTPQSCGRVECESQCQQQGYSNAVCISDTCYCYSNKRELKLLSSESLDNTCPLSWCQSQCQAVNHLSGICNGDKCFCYKSIKRVMRLPSDQDEESCETSACDSDCQLRGHFMGMCLGDKCFCLDDEKVATTNFEANALLYLRRSKRFKL